MWVVLTEFAEHELKPTLFTYSELQKATRDFHADNRLGEGAFGAVYLVSNKEFKCKVFFTFFVKLFVYWSILMLGLI